MRYALLLLVCVASLAADIPVPDGGRFHRVLYFGGGADVGEVLPLHGTFRVIMLLYLDDPCPLPVLHADNMRKYEGDSGNGCWYPTLGGGFTILLENGYAWNSPGLKNLDEGLFNENNHMLQVIRVNRLGATNQEKSP